jgi:hypothetical protein
VERSRTHRSRWPRIRESHPGPGLAHSSPDGPYMPGTGTSFRRR